MGSSTRSVGSNNSRASRGQRSLPTATPFMTARKPNNTRSSQQQQQTPYYTASSRPGRQGRTIKTSPSSTSVFDRLYRKERRNTSLWTDPAMKEDSTYKFVASGGASRTSVISIYHHNHHPGGTSSGSVATPSVPRKLNFNHVGTMDGNMSGQLATMIQRLVRYHQAQSRLVGRLIQSSSVSCYLPITGEDNNEGDGGVRFAPTANRILGLKYQVLARATAIQHSHISQLDEHVVSHENSSGGTVSLSTTFHVSFPAWDDANCIVQQNFAVTVECDAKMVKASRSWSRRKLGYMLYHHALEASYHAYTNKLINEAANLLKQWFFAMVYQKRKKSSEQPSPTNSVSSENSMQRRIDTFNSLAWFHSRLQTETRSARQETFDFAATVLQRNFRGMLARQDYQALLDVQDLQDILCQRYTEEVLEGAASLLQRTWRQVRTRKQYERTRRSILRLQALWRSNRVRNELATVSAYALQVAWRQRIYRRQNLDASIIAIQSLWRTSIARRRYHQLLKAVVSVQAMERGRRKQLQYYVILYGVLRIQSLWRSWQTRHQVNALAIASTTKSVLLAWQERNIQTQDYTVIISIQALIRMYLSRTQTFV